MPKIVWSAGHSINTAENRTPEDEREWSFNNKVVLAGMTLLAKYEGVLQYRVDDPSGKSDVPLFTRTNQANTWNADIYVSCHHNVSGTEWRNHGGVETYVLEPTAKDSSSLRLANLIHPKVVSAMGLTNRGVKTANFHELRETKMPAVLVQGGFMDSRIDIIKMRDGGFLKAQGEAIASGIAEYFGLKLKEVKGEKLPLKGKLFNTGSMTLNDEFKDMLVKARKQGIITSNEWEQKADKGTLTESEAIALTALVMKRVYLDNN